MNDQDRAALSKQVADDVQKRLHEHVFGAAPGDSKGQPHVLKSGLGLPDFTGSLAPIIKSGIDLAVQLAGSAVENLVLKDRDALRSVLSDRTLQYLQGLIQDLQVPLPPAPKTATGLTSGVPAPKGRTA